MSVILYTFEDGEGHTDDYSTFSAAKAIMHGRKRHRKVIANEYTFSDSEVVWDFTEKGFDMWLRSQPEAGIAPSEKREGE